MFSQTNHVVSDEDKAAALDFIKQAAIKLGIPPNLPIAGRNRQGMGQANAGFVQDSIAAAITFPTIPSGEIDARLMQDKYGAFQDFSEINNILWPLALNSLNVGRLHGQDLMVSSNSIKSSFVEAAKNRADLKPTADKLKQRYARARKDEAAAKKAAKEAAAKAKAAAKQEGSSDENPA